MAEQIERDKVYNALHSVMSDYENSGCSYAEIDRAESALDFVEDRINNIPTADVRSVAHGKWEDVYDSSKEREVTKCSVCHGITIYFDSPFCQWCGARMDEEAENNE